jgi:hypothetical protein
MDAQPVFSTSDFMQAEAACEELRAHDIKCGSVETAPRYGGAGLFAAPPWRGLPSGPGHTGQWEVIVAPEDLERAREVLREWGG